jgi:hypothetical protein
MTETEQEYAEIGLGLLSEKDHDSEGYETDWAAKSNKDAYELG